MAELLAELAARHPSVGAVRSIGLFGIVELIRNRATREPMAPFNGSAPEMVALGKFFRQEGLYTFVRWNTFFTNPPLTITEAELRDGFAIIDRGLAACDDAVAGLRPIAAVYGATPGDAASPCACSTMRAGIAARSPAGRTSHSIAVGDANSTSISRGVVGRRRRAASGGTRRSAGGEASHVGRWRARQRAALHVERVCRPGARCRDRARRPPTCRGRATPASPRRSPIPAARV